MNKFSMTVNNVNLIKSLKLSFTNNTTFIGELMQNARRANSTHVSFEFTPDTKTLRTTDNGCGINSIETLLTIAESGWDVDTVAQEHPFGIGFLSSLFICSHITVVSKGGRICADTDDILSFKPITILPVTEWDGITSIVMVDIDLEVNQIEDILKRLAIGFPIPVQFNGTFLNRDHAVDSGCDFSETLIGSVFVSGVNEPDRANYEFCVYLQGLPIYRSQMNSWLNLEHCHIIHLDSSRFYARLPDRDKLIDEADVIKQVRSILKDEIEKRFVEMKATIPPEDFVGYFEMMKKWNLLALLNDVPVVPPAVLVKHIDYPNCNTEYFDNYQMGFKLPITRDEILLGRQVVMFEEDMENEGSALSMYIWKKELLVYGESSKLDNNHWLHSHIRNLNKEEVHVELVNEAHTASFEGEWACHNARFCDFYRIHVGSDVVDFHNDAMFDGTSAIVPNGDGSGLVLTQSNTFNDEHDFQRGMYEVDEYAFSQFVVANTSSDPAIAFKRLLPGFKGCPSVYKTSFIVNIDETGIVSSVTIA